MNHSVDEVRATTGRTLPLGSTLVRADEQVNQLDQQIASVDLTKVAQRPLRWFHHPPRRRRHQSLRSGPNPESSSSPGGFRADETPGNVERGQEQTHAHGRGFSRRQVRFQAAERPAHLCRKSSAHGRGRLRSDPLGFRIHHRPRLWQKQTQSIARRLQDQSRRGEAGAAGSNRGRSQPDFNSRATQGSTKLPSAWGTSWSTTPTPGCGPSSTAASTTDSSWCTTKPTTWCRRTRSAETLAISRLIRASCGRRFGRNAFVSERPRGLSRTRVPSVTWAG